MGPDPRLVHDRERVDAARAISSKKASELAHTGIGQGPTGLPSLTHSVLSGTHATDPTFRLIGYLGCTLYLVYSQPPRAYGSFASVIVGKHRGWLFNPRSEQ